MSKISSRGNLVATNIRDLVPFETHGALKAVNSSEGIGQLNANEYHLFINDVNDIDYIVYSYATPIAWHSRSNGWHKVSQKFSVTTSRHQSSLYMI